jgi:hypothetical protein
MFLAEAVTGIPVGHTQGTQSREDNKGPDSDLNQIRDLARSDLIQTIFIFSALRALRELLKDPTFTTNGAFNPL